MRMKLIEKLLSLQFLKTIELSLKEIQSARHFGQKETSKAICRLIKLKVKEDSQELE